MRSLFWSSSVVLAAMLLGPAAQAQDILSSGGMLQGTIQSQIDNSTNERMIEDTKQHDRDVYLRRNGSNGRPTAAVPNYILDRTQNTSMAALNPEYNRRLTAYGKARADQWMTNAARSVGRDVGSLVPEYRRRIQSQGQARADNWYVAQARDISQRYVANSTK